MNVLCFRLHFLRYRTGISSQLYRLMSYKKLTPLACLCSRNGNFC